MKNKLFHIGLLIASLLGYLEWGESESAFLFQMEWDIFKKLFTDTQSIIHPLIIIPIIGQILILVNLLKASMNKKLTYVAVACLGLLYVLLLLVNLIAFNPKGLLSLIPFFLMAILLIRLTRRQKKV